MHVSYKLRQKRRLIANEPGKTQVAGDTGNAVRQIQGLTSIADLPGHYLNWFAREGFPKGELGGLLALMQEIDHNGLGALLDPLRTRPRQSFKDKG